MPLFVDDKLIVYRYINLRLPLPLATDGWLTQAVSIAVICRIADCLLDENQGLYDDLLFLLGRSNLEESDVQRYQCSSQTKRDGGVPRA